MSQPYNFIRTFHLWFQTKVKISGLDFHCTSVIFQTVITVHKGALKNKIK